MSDKPQTHRMVMIGGLAEQILLAIIESGHLAEDKSFPFVDYSVALATEMFDAQDRLRQLGRALDEGEEGVPS